MSFPVKGSPSNFSAMGSQLLQKAGIGWQPVKVNVHRGNSQSVANRSRWRTVYLSSYRQTFREITCVLLKKFKQNETLLSLGITLTIYHSLYWLFLHLCLTLPAPSGHFLDRECPVLKSLLKPLLLGEPRLGQLSFKYLLFKELIRFQHSKLKISSRIWGRGPKSVLSVTIMF